MRFESQLSRMNCQMFSCGFSSGHLAGSGMRVMLEGTFKPARKMPSGLINEDGGVCVRRNLRGDLGEMQVHRLGVATRHDERRAFALLGQIAPKYRPKRFADRSGRWGASRAWPIAA